MPPTIPGLFYRIAGAIHLAGGNIIDARIHTTRDGMAVDNFLVQDPLGRPFDEAEQLDAAARRRSRTRWPTAIELADRSSPSARCRAPRAEALRRSRPTC